MSTTRNRQFQVAACLLLALASGAWQAKGREESSARATYQFERAGPFVGEVRSLLWSSRHAGLVFLGTSDGQLYRSRDSGAHWEHLHPGIGHRGYVLDSLAEHPTDPDRFFAGAWDRNSTGGGLFESGDGGRSWRRLAIPAAAASIRDFAICRSRPERMIAGTLGGLYTSRDGGASWTLAKKTEGDPDHIESVAIDPIDPDNVYVGTWRLGFRSNDFGLTWEGNDRGMIFDSDVFSLAVHQDRPERVYASACTGIYRSSDGARSWKRLMPFPGRSVVRTHVILIDRSRPSRLLAGTTEGLLASEDEGNAWRRVTPADWTVNAIQINPRNGMEILIGTGAEGVMRSMDGGRTWQPSSEGFSHAQIPRILPDLASPGRFFVAVASGGSDGGVYRFDNHRSEWRKLGMTVAEARAARVLMTLPGRDAQLASTDRGVLLRDGTKWTRLSGALSRLTVSDLLFEPGGSWIFAATRQGIYRAKPDRLDFEMPGPPFLPEVYSLALRPGPNPVIFAACSLGVARSRDAGVTWQVISTGLPLFERVRVVAACPAENGPLLAGTAKGLFRSRDDGRSWQQITDPSMKGDIASVMYLDPNGRHVAASNIKGGGVYLSEDGGEHWSRIFSPEFDSPVLDIAHDVTNPGMLYLGTQTDGVYRLRLGSSSANLPAR